MASVLTSAGVTRGHPVTRSSRRRWSSSIPLHPSRGSSSIPLYPRRGQHTCRLCLTQSSSSGDRAEEPVSQEWQEQPAHAEQQQQQPHLPHVSAAPPPPLPAATSKWALAGTLGVVTTTAILNRLLYKVRRPRSWTPACTTRNTAWTLACTTHQSAAHHGCLIMAADGTGAT